jgi:phosphate:Na+ symporter
MEADIFKDIIVPVIGGLGIFMLGLEFMSNGIQSLAVNRMRAMLAKVAGTPITGLVAGTLITGVIQSSTAMTVMVVGLVNAGVLALRPAISVIMGANIGTTLTNTLIALPLGLYGLLFAGIFALIMVFSKKESRRNIMLASLGFALVFYGLSMMTGGLKPLRNMPEVMEVISSLSADGYLNIFYCVVVAAIITALIHSSSATIGIVMGLGASGVLEWQTALAFSLGADLGTTITSFIASLNLSKNAKRAAYAHMSFNLIGVAVMLPLFPLATSILTWFIGDPSVPTVVDGHEVFPLVPLAVGIYSTAFNIFNTLLLFPFIGIFDRVLSRIGHSAVEDIEDYSTPRFLDARIRSDLAKAVQAVQKETARYLEAAAKFLAIARGEKGAPADVEAHYTATDILSRQIRQYTAALFQPGMPYPQANLVASLIEEEDFIGSLGETLYQVARRVQRQPFSSIGRDLVNAAVDQVGDALRAVTSEDWESNPRAAYAAERLPAVVALRDRVLRTGPELPAIERGAILALLGSVERAFVLIERIDAERRSVARVVPADAMSAERRAGELGSAAPMPA